VVADCELQLAKAIEMEMEMEAGAFNGSERRSGAPNEPERHSHSKTMMSAAVRRDQKDQEPYQKTPVGGGSGQEQTWPASTSTCRQMRKARDFRSSEVGAREAFVGNAMAVINVPWLKGTWAIPTNSTGLLLLKKKLYEFKLNNVLVKKHLLIIGFQKSNII